MPKHVMLNINLEINAKRPQKINHHGCTTVAVKWKGDQVFMYIVHCIEHTIRT